MVGESYRAVAARRSKNFASHHSRCLGARLYALPFSGQDDGGHGGCKPRRRKLTAEKPAIGCTSPAGDGGDDVIIDRAKADHGPHSVAERKSVRDGEDG